MADLHRRAAANTTRLTPEEITNRGFASAFRGVSETEVRNFLRRVADEMVAMRDREADLLRQVEDLREQIRNPAPVTEEQLLSSLGEETARVLRSAQDAAEEIRKRSEERAGTLVREAQEESGRLREEAAQHAAARTETAEQTAAE
ncbi:MAG: DivIVA domain-containing protein, partial [Actinomycetota bacterium]